MVSFPEGMVKTESDDKERSMDLVGCPTERSEVHETQTKDEKGFKFQDGDKLR